MSNEETKGSKVGPRTTIKAPITPPPLYACQLIDGFYEPRELLTDHGIEDIENKQTLSEFTNNVVEVQGFMMTEQNNIKRQIHNNNLLLWIIFWMLLVIMIGVI